MTSPVHSGRRHPRRDDPVTLRLYVQLEDAEPPVWRRLDVASDLGLDDLHDVLQVAFGWEDRHLYRFTTGPQFEEGTAFACAADLREAWDDDLASPTWDVRIGELLAEQGERLSYQYDYGDNWRLRTLASLADGAVEIDEAAAARMLRPLLVLLDTVGDGVELTAAGYLPPAIVSPVFDELGLADEWIGKGNREDLTLPVLELREGAQLLGLLRKYKGRLVPTSRGRKLTVDPIGTWWELAGRLPIGGRGATGASWQAGVLLLALMATGSTEQVEAEIAQLLTGLGWALEGGHPIGRRTAVGPVAGRPLAAAIWCVRREPLRQLARQGHRWRRRSGSGCARRARHIGLRIVAPARGVSVVARIRMHRWLDRCRPCRPATRPPRSSTPPAGPTWQP